MNIWHILGIDPTLDKKIIRQAYAKKLKDNKPESKPKEFMLLRKAYEMAIEYSDGKSNSEALETIEFNNDNGSLINLINIDKDDDVKTLVKSILGMLNNNENDAINFIKNLSIKNAFDNLIFLEKFQCELALNLLEYTPRNNSFVCFCVDHFGWGKYLDSRVDRSLFKTAIINLISNSSHVSFLNNLFFISKIKSVKEAEKINTKFEDCFAADILLNPINIINFFIIALFFEKRRTAILALLDIIKLRYPQCVGLGLSLSSISWWNAYRIGIFHDYLSKFIIGVLLITMYFFTFGEFKSDRNYTQAQPATNKANKVDTSYTGNKYQIDGYIRTERLQLQKI